MNTTNVGDLVAHFLKTQGVKRTFSIISVHNIPIMDGIARAGGIDVVMTRGEMGGAHMADACARVTGELGVLISSTGPGAANAVSGLLEAEFAGTPLLHITGQVPRQFLGRDTGATHNVKDQLGMMASVCKAAFRIHTAEQACGVLRQAAQLALTAPMGPVSVEIPIDVQKTAIDLPADNTPVTALPLPTASEESLDALAQGVLSAKRPMLWVGRGAIDCGPQLRQLLDEGFAMVSSWAGRGIVPEDDPRTLAGLNGTGAPDVVKFYETVDLMLVVGSRMRGQETVDQSLAVPARRIQIDANPLAQGRTYSSEQFVCGDARQVLDGLLQRIRGKLQVAPGYQAEFAQLKATARAAFKETLGPYASFPEQLRAVLPRDCLWVRDITVANSTWGNRLFEVYGPRDAVHPVGAGIGQGLPLGIGAACAAGGRKTVVLSGDAGFIMNVGELWTAVQEKLDLLCIVMNDAGYGVIKHMQDAGFGGRRVYGDLLPPNFEALAQAVGMRYAKVTQAERFGETVAQMLTHKGLALVEVDMKVIGEAPPYFPYRK